jgi:hypothetical protein
LFEVKRTLDSSPLWRSTLRGYSARSMPGWILEPWEVWVVLDHVGVPVSDFVRSKRFYAAALSPLGYELIMEPSVSAAGFGGWGKPEFWISQGEASQGMSGPHEAR